MTRDALAWRITVPADGSLPEAGASPTLIQWDAQPHPATVLQDAGCTLQALEIFHSTPDDLHGTLHAVGFEGNVQVHPLPPGASPHLLAYIRTPHGLRTLPADFSD